MRGPVFAVVFALVAWASAPAFALEPDRPLDQFTPSHFDSANGMPHSLASSVVQTADGFLWVGSEEGLSRFDGRQFTTITRRDGLPTNVIQTLLADGNTVWAGTRDRGLVKIVDRRVVRVDDPRIGIQIRALARDEHGDIWVGSRDAGAARLHDGAVVETVQPPSTDVRSLLVTRHGELWIGTYHGAFLRSGGKLVPAQLGDVAVLSIAEDDRGRLWFATSRGLARVDHETTWIPDTAIIATGKVLCDREGSVWLGLEGSLVRISRDGTIARAPQGVVRDLFEDAAGDLWIGTSAGLDRLASGDVHAYGEHEGLTDGAIFGIGQDATGAMWFVGDDGAFRMVENRIERIANDRGVLYGVHGMASGAVWIGARDGSLGRWRDGVFEWVLRGEWDAIRTFADAPDGIWIGTERGLYRLRDHATQPELVVPGVIVSAIYTAPDGTLWLGTQGTGLVTYPAGKLAGGPSATSSVSTFFTDRNGDRFVGTEGDGLWRLRGTTWTHFGREQGMADDVIWKILDDDRGRLWFSSNRAIWRVEHAAFETGQLVSTSYGVADGMRDRECNGNVAEPGWKTADGRLWFANLKGAVAIDPAHLTSVLLPATSLEEIQIDGHAVARDHVELAPESSRLSVRYAAPELRHPGRVRYRYRLLGFDHGWIDAGDRREADFTNLEPGAYTLVVEAMVNGVAGPAARLALTVEPHVYQRWWFRSLAVIAALGIVLAIPLLRVRRLRAHAAELDRRIQEAIGELKVLKGMIPICAWCKKIRDDADKWNKLEAYISNHTDAKFTHGICPDCAHQLDEEDP